MRTIFLVTGFWADDVEDRWIIKAFRNEDTAHQFIADNSNRKMHYTIEEVQFE